MRLSSKRDGIRQKRSAFTLVELLVVITIIVILIALLSPALDKAVQAAELARCAAQQDRIISTTFLYAMDHKRTYPRPAVMRDAGYQPNLIGWRNSAANIQRDMRPVLKGWVTLEELLCPLAPAPPLDLSIEGNEDGTQVFSNYALFFGFQYTGHKAMSKMGDSLTAKHPGNEAPQNFNVMVTDKNLENFAGSAQFLHPDSEGRGAVYYYFNKAPSPTASVFDIDYGGVKITQSYWTSGPGNALRRGLIDLNFGLSDGSVIRLGNVGIGDERLRAAPAHADGTSSPAFGFMLP